MVDPLNATAGKPHTLWCAFAQFYERFREVAQARVVFEKAVKEPFKGVDDLASVWCEYAEMELRCRNVDQARELLERATTQHPASLRNTQKDKLDSGPVQHRLHRSTKLWCFYADLTESLETVKRTSAVYDRMLDLKVATPQVVLCYAHFLEEHKYFEESFKAYERGAYLPTPPAPTGRHLSATTRERGPCNATTAAAFACRPACLPDTPGVAAVAGVSAFGFPHVHDIWLEYLNKFVERYGGRKLERARDLFEQVLTVCPAKPVKLFYLMYAKLEEEHGLVRHAMNIYDRATKAVHDADKYELYQISVKKAAEYFGVTHTRDIFERSIEALSSDDVRTMCLQYADLERRLGEIDRSRAIFAHASQFCDPRMQAEFWGKFNDFEVHHGNEDTFREMLRLKRSVAATFTEVTLASGDLMRGGDIAADKAGAAAASDPMASLDAAAAGGAEGGGGGGGGG
eukprot:SAG22_NODE_3196_length_1862_cov_2.152014_1_plen_457_part_10